MGNHTSTRPRGRAGSEPSSRPARSHEDAALVRATRAYRVALGAESQARAAYQQAHVAALSWARGHGLDPVQAARGDLTVQATRDAFLRAEQRTWAALLPYHDAAIAADLARGGPGVFVHYQNADAQDALRRTLGREADTSTRLARLTGATHGDTIEVRPYVRASTTTGVSLTRFNETARGSRADVATAELAFGRMSPGAARVVGLPAGALVMDVPWVSSGTGGKSWASGRQMLAGLRAAIDLGVVRIHAAAAGPPLNGYETWAALGADGELPRHTLVGARARFGSGVTTVQQLRAAPGGAAWWRKHGDSFEATFDLTPGSDTRRILDRLTRSV